MAVTFSLLARPKSAVPCLNRKKLSALALLLFFCIFNLNFHPSLFSDSFRFLSLNIYEGGGIQEWERGEEGGRLTKIQMWVKSQNPHVVALLELNDWTKSQLDHVAKGWNHEHTYLMCTNSHGSQYNLGVTSVYPLRDAEEYLDDFWHGLLQVKIEIPINNQHVCTQPLLSRSFVNDVCFITDCSPRTTFHILITHLNPHSSGARLLETKKIIKISQEIMNRERDLARKTTEKIDLGGGNIILLGDLNTLSPTENQEKLLPLLLSRKSLSQKFLSPITREIDYSPLRTLLSLLHDISPIPLRHTVPTHFCSDPMHVCPLRLDYAMVSESVRSQFDASVTISDDALVNTLSDHFPLLLTLTARRC